jgi:HK97 family phage major capsid protein
MASPIAQRIEDAQEHLNALKDALQQHLDKVDDQNVTDDQLAITTEFNEKIERTEKSLETLKQAEVRLAATSMPTAPKGDGLIIQNARPFAVPAVKVKPIDYMWRALTVAVKTLHDTKKRPALTVLTETYGEDEGTKVMHDVITRAATVPADTTTSGWASQLVQTSLGEFFASLTPNSVYPALASRGGSFTFGRNGVINLPTRAASPTIAGAFVAQLAPIPVRQGAFTSVQLLPKKMGVITTFSREISEHSTPAIEGLLRQAIVDDTSVAIDTILLDATAADTTRPAGLRASVSESANSATTTIVGMVADLKTLAAVLITGTNGNIRNPVWIMNPSLVLTISTTAGTSAEVYPFKAELAAGTLFGWPVIQSTNIPVDRIIALDSASADFITATGDTPRFDVSDQATIHLEDTTPLALGTSAATNTIAAPTRSLWQTDTIGIRMLLDINWAMRRTGVVAWSETFAWD